MSLRVGVYSSNNSTEIIMEVNHVLLNRKVYSIRNQVLAFHNFIIILFCIYLHSSISTVRVFMSTGGLKEERWGLKERNQRSYMDTNY